MNNCATITGRVVEQYPEVCRIASRPRILYVDDSDFVRDAICSIFAMKGWGCESANCAMTALLWLASRPESVDILITDHQMPGMNGLEFVRKLRATLFTGKILVHSTMLSDEDRAAYEELEVDAIVTKNGNPERLLNTIEELSRRIFRGQKT